MIFDKSYSENLNENLCAYQKVKYAILDYINKNNLKEGDKIPTEVELASFFKLSRITVSKAINELAGDGILERIKGSGTYVTHKNAKNIRIAVYSTPESSDQFVSYLYSGMRLACAENSVEVVYFNEILDMDINILRNMKIDGVLSLAYLTSHIPIMYDLQSAGIPVVSLASRTRVKGFSSVCIDNYAGICEACQYLIDMGHKKIAYISGGLGSSDVQERIWGVTNTFAKNNIDLDPSLMLLTSGRIVPEYLNYWYDSLVEKPTAILVSPYVLMQVFGILNNYNLRIPKDMSIIVIDDNDMVNVFVPKLTKVRQPVTEMGKRGIEKLIKLIHKEEEPCEEVLLPEFIVGDSVLNLKEEEN